jgi:CRP-like cAMP-binding protein
LRELPVDLLIRKLEERDRLSEEEKQVLAASLGPPKSVSADADMVREGDRPSESTLLVEGFAARYKVLQSGKRQITAIHVPGDFVDLHGFLLKKMDHAIAALTPCTVATVPHETLRRITERHPHLARLLWLSTLIDSAIHREWLVAMGRRSAKEHMAHLFCELYLRLQLVGLTKDNSYEMPITQAELGDTLGISTVHVNRVVQELRAEGLITWRGNRLAVDDWDRLREVAEFTPTYLSLFNERR